MEKPMSPIRVLHVSATSTGGVGLNLRLLARHLRTPDIELHFSMPDDSHFFGEIAQACDHVFPLDMKRRPLRFGNVSAALRLDGLMRENRYDIVHCHASVGGAIGRVVGKMHGAKTIWSIHGWAFNYPLFRGAKAEVFKWMEKGLARITDHYVAVSRDMIDVAVREDIASPEKMTLIYHGIEDLAGGPERRGETWDGTDGEVVVGCLGRLEPQKALDVFLRAARIVADRCRNVRFDIVGDGPLRNALESLAAEQGLAERVRFLGWKSRVDEYIGAFDVFCMTSRWEALPMVLLEVMEHGKAVVSTDVGGVREVIVDGEGGILVAPESPEAVAGALVRLIEDRKLRARMGAYNRRRRRELFGVARMIGEYADLYRRLSGRVRGPAPHGSDAPGRIAGPLLT